MLRGYDKPFITKVKIQSTQEDFYKKSIVWSEDHASMPYYGSSNAVMEGAGHPIKKELLVRWCLLANERESASDS